MTIIGASNYANYSIRGHVFLLAAAAIFALAAIAFNELFTERRFLEKFPVDLTLDGLIRAAFCASAGVLVAYALRPSGASVAARTEWSWTLLLTTYGSFFIVAASVAVSVVAPQALGWMIEELQPISLAQEAILFVAIVILIATAMRVKANPNTFVGPISGRNVCFAMAAALTVLFLEEISYGQHFIGWSTPAAFEGNAQNETNLHNFYTHRFELVYYAAPLVAFVALPFAISSLPQPIKSMIGFYIPPRAFAAASLPVAGYLVQTWNLIPLQIGFFFAVMAGLLLCTCANATDRSLRTITLVSLFALIGGQIVFVAAGPHLVLGHEFSELKELHIIWLIFCYSLWLSIRMRTVGKNASLTEF